MISTKTLSEEREECEERQVDHKEAALGENEMHRLASRRGLLR